MIEQIRIMSRSGANIYSGRIKLGSETNVNIEDTDVLFAGFISAILSVSEELENSDIRELGYQENKIIFTLTENLIFLGFASQKVPNSDIDNLLSTIKENWMEEFEDKEYPYVSNEMKQKISKMVAESVDSVFWWSKAEYNLRGNRKFIKQLLTRPGASYFTQYLPNEFIFTSISFLLLSILSSVIFRASYTGFSVDRSTTFFDSLATTGPTLLLFFFGIPLLMKMANPIDFAFNDFLKISGIYMILTILMYLIAGHWYGSYVLDPLISATQGIVLLQGLIIIFIFFGPINVSLFGYIIFLGYSGVNLFQGKNIQYYVSYLFSVLLVISISEILLGSLI